MMLILSNAIANAILKKLQRDEKIVMSYVNIRLILVSLACSCQFL